jgi:hypothetical protein
VTALFADTKGSTELMEELDPEEARCYDGYVVQIDGRRDLCPRGKAGEPGLTPISFRSGSRVLEIVHLRA